LPVKVPATVAIRAVPVAVDFKVIKPAVVNSPTVIFTKESISVCLFKVTLAAIV
jgi:hypothetical protein